MSEPVKDTEETQHADDNSQGKRMLKEKIIEIKTIKIYYLVIKDSCK